MTRLSLAILVALAGSLVCSACGEERAEPQAQGIDRDIFVATYVDLRRTVRENPTKPIAPQERERILREHGVTSEDLLQFVEIHGRDLDYMSAVWDTVEARLQAQDEPDDSASVAGETPDADGPSG